MEEKTEVFAVFLAREDGDSNFIDLGDWETAFHAIRGRLKMSDLVVGLSKWGFLTV